MIDFDEYDSLFQKMEDLFQGLTTSVVPDKKQSIVEDDSEGNDVIVTRRRDPCSLVDERDDLDAEFDILKETEDKIAAELLELTALIHSGSSEDDRSTRERPGNLGHDGKVQSSGHKRTESTELDKAILKQLEEFRASGRSTKRQDKKKKKNQVIRDEKIMKQIDTLQEISGSQDEVHIFQSNSQLDSSLDASQHHNAARKAIVKNHCSTEQYAEEEETVEVTICYNNLGIELDGSVNFAIMERELKETYPLEFPGRSPTPPKCALSFLFRDPASITSSSSEESSLVWLEER